MTRQSILTVDTERRSLRADIVGWSCDSGHTIDTSQPIGMSRTPRRYTYPTVMHALAAGWRLLGPPQYADGMWEWWLERWGTEQEIGDLL